VGRNDVPVPPPAELLEAVLDSDDALVRIEVEAVGDPVVREHAVDAAPVELGHER
jgi:hypothetical protein